MAGARSVTRLAEQPARRRCGGGSSAGVALANAEEPKSGAAREGGEQGQAGIEPARPWPALWGKCYALNITGCYAKCRQSLRLVSAPLRLRLRALRVRVTPVMSGAPPRRPAAPAAPAPLQQPACALAAAPPARPAKAKPTSPRPPRAVCCARAPALRASRPVLAAVPPVRPRQRGLPKGQGKSQGKGKGPTPQPAPWGKAPAVGPRRLAPCSPRQGFGLRPARAARP